MKVRTIKNNPADRSDEAKFELEKLLRIWQDWQFWNQTFDKDLDKVVQEIWELLDDNES